MKFCCSVKPASKGPKMFSPTGNCFPVRSSVPATVVKATSPSSDAAQGGSVHALLLPPPAAPAPPPVVPPPVVSPTSSGGGGQSAPVGGPPLQGGPPVNVGVLPSAGHTQSEPAAAAPSAGSGAGVGAGVGVVSPGPLPPGVPPGPPPGAPPGPPGPPTCAPANRSPSRHCSSSSHRRPIIVMISHGPVPAAALSGAQILQHQSVPSGLLECGTPTSRASSST
jgi:hypothetical protein